MSLEVLRRSFRARVTPEQAWAWLERVSEWPTWAHHIRTIDLTPPGALQPGSRGVIQLTNGIRTTFQMEELNPGRNWRWRGPFLWLVVHYDHRFARVSDAETEITFVIEVEGFAAAIFGRIFAAIYSINLDRAIPRLIAELERLRPL